MNQISTAVSTVPQAKKPSRFSRSVMFAGGMFMLALQLIAGEANAINIPVSSFTCTQTSTATSTCVGTGFYAAGWQSGTGYWQYNLNAGGYSGITMTFTNTKSSAPGPASGQVYYNIGAGDVAVPGGSFAVTTSCQTQTISLPAACNGATNLIIRVKMLGATNNTATHRITSQNVFDGASTTCSTAPAGGTVSAGTNPVCNGNTTTLTVAGNGNGAGITTKWQTSPNNTSWTDIPGATGTTYTTAPLTATAYYRAVTTCAAVPGTPVASTNSVQVTVNTVAIGNVLANSPMLVDEVQTLTNSTPGGLWLSSRPNVASIDASGNLTGKFGGNTEVTYQVTDLATGCVGSKSVSVDVIWPNTLALYAGVDGTSTDVIPVPDDIVSQLKATGFGTTTPCGSGGLSGLTVTVANNAYNKDSARVSYIVKPEVGMALNMSRIHARARVSSTGATKARIAYRVANAGVWGPWVAQANDQALVSGNCGASANSWDFYTGNTANPNPTVNGIKDSLEVAVFPFAPGAATGTFQLNTLEVYGIVTTNANCNAGTVATTADSVLPAVVTICDTGSRFLNYNLGTGGVAGVGITYQWQSSLSPTSGFADIAGATGAVYNTGNLTTAGTRYYRVKVTCSISGTSDFSAVSSLTVAPTPANAGTISGAIASSTAIPFRHALIGTAYTLSSTVTGGTWSSNDTSVISINPTSGAITANIPGDAIITYRKDVNGCFGVTRDTVIAYRPGTKALYVGRGGNSTNVYAVAGVNGTSATALTLANWGSTTPCGNGGISGLTNTTTAVDQTTNGSIVTRVAATGAAFNATAITVTPRGTGAGTYKLYLAAKAVGSSLWTVSTPVDVEADDCGYSHNEVVFTLPSAISVTPAGVDFAVFGYNGATTNGLQINSFSVIGTGNAIISGNTGVNAFAAAQVELYPNPAKNTLNVKAAEQVNVVILSIDGKKLIERNNVKSVDVSSLVSGMYLIQVYNADNSALLKADKFVKH
ncbi:T9SS type A sorting domain-containing protein [Taibaiella chishuiensis]|uniref:Putative secreted protein (Por secretion system target) n=1 Tax=Taibaiella chishuiensis TaxID=1434707 RepID=A0A2P8DD46_9BACT|nr:T9SS type A sorting domain-containing protein [Taibaiella chishuiensis]PSK95144.1 putative secreted protein (Por secretion system target) [Taibaiella chishuiensis]